MKIDLVYTLLDLGIQAGRSFSAMPGFVYSLSDNLSVNVNKNIIAGADPGFQKGGWMADGGSTRHLGNYPQDPGNEVAIKPEHRLSTWVGKRERFPTNFAIMSQSESYFASLGVVKWLPCELLREKWRQTTKRGVTTTRHERELIFLSFFIFYFK